MTYKVTVIKGEKVVAEVEIDETPEGRRVMGATRQAIDNLLEARKDVRTGSSFPIEVVVDKGLHKISEAFERAFLDRDR